MKGIFGTIVLLVGCMGIAQAQPQLLDKVAAIVGENVVLKSDVDIQTIQYQSQGVAAPNLECMVMDQLLTQKILLAKAREDSIVISDDEVNNELDRRMRYFIGLVGSQEKFEEFYGKTVEEYKEDFREDIRKQILAQRVQGLIVGDVPISPKEVRAYFNKIPQDSLPYYNSEVEFEQIVLYPKVGREQELVAKAQLERLRTDIVEKGKDFSFMAELYSCDQVSAKQGGSLGCFGKGQMVKEFESRAFSNPIGEVSEVFKTQYGYHIMIVDKREDDQVCARHILICTEVSESDAKATIGKLDSIRANVIAGTMNFETAVVKYSDEQQALVTNPQTGQSVFDVTTLSQLDPSLMLAASDLKVGEVSQPVAFQKPSGEKGYRILRLKSQTEPHKANLDQDWAKIQTAALSKKKAERFEEWLQDFKTRTYIHIDDEYKTCDELTKRWLVNNN